MISAFILATFYLLSGISTIAANPGDTIPSIARASSVPAHLESAIAIARAAIAQDLNSETAGNAAVAIIEDGRIAYSENFGLADREKSQQVTSDTLFNIGSISKAFTASAMISARRRRQG